jgi:hypothetical protein
MTETQTAPTTPDWLTPGAAVASVTDRRGSMRVARSTVERIGKRDVVLANGERFNARTQRRNEGGGWGWTVELLPADDPRVAATEAAIRESRARSHAITAVDEWRIAAGAGRDPRPVIKAMAALLPAEQRDRILAALEA